jgi:hypothetical protein
MGLGHAGGMKLFRSLLIAGVALAVCAPGASAQVREYEGTVVSVNRAGKTFKLRDAERGTIRVTVTKRTRFERVRFSQLRAGMRCIEVEVRRANGRWVAREVERSGKVNRRGGCDDDHHDDDDD